MNYTIKNKLLTISPYNKGKYEIVSEIIPSWLDGKYITTVKMSYKRKSLEKQFIVTLSKKGWEDEYIIYLNHLEEKELINDLWFPIPEKYLNN